MRGPFSKELLLQSGMLQQQTECIAIIYKHLGVLMTPAHLYWLLGQICPRWIQDRAIIKQWEPFSKGLLLHSWKATATNRMYSSDFIAFGKKCCYFFFVPFWCLVFDMFWCCALDLVISTYLNHVNGTKCLININLCTFHVIQKKNSTRLQWYSCTRYKAPGPLVVLCIFDICC